jgi:two-component system, OmpR family, response regulator MprA
VTVLVVDDDLAVRESLERALRGHGFTVELAVDGVEALTMLHGREYEAVVLDLMMPRLDGVAVCRFVRTAGNQVPILMLTARDAVPDRVTGLEAGADDYVVKPFALEELLARLRALLRRSKPASENSVLRFGDLELDTSAVTVLRGGRPIELRRMEFQLLELFMLNQRRVLSRSQIYDGVWGYDFGPASNSLDVQLGHLRRKLEEGGEPRVIHTLRGMGYVLREAP